MARREKIRFLILANMRTGSRWLHDLIDSHPEACCLHELLNGAELHLTKNREFFREKFGYPTPMFPPALKMGWYFLSAFRKHHAAGFRLFPEHMSYPGSEELVRKWNDAEDVRVIELQRKNLLRSYTSLRIAEEFDIWRVEYRADYTSIERRVKIDPEAFTEYATQLKNASQELRERLEERPLIRVAYEDLLQEPEEQCNRLLDFLDLPRHALSSDIKRTNPEPLPQLITNWPELVGKLSGTEYEWMTAEP